MSQIQLQLVSKEAPLNAPRARKLPLKAVHPLNSDLPRLPAGRTTLISRILQASPRASPKAAEPSPPKQSIKAFTLQIPTFKQEEDEDDSQNATRYLRGLSQTNRLMMSTFRGKEAVALPQLQKAEVSYIRLKQIQYRNRIRIKSQEPSH